MAEPKIEAVLDHVKELLLDLPEDDRSGVAMDICFEAINWGSHNHFEALGILSETAMRYREVSLAILDEEADEDAGDFSLPLPGMTLSGGEA